MSKPGLKVVGKYTAPKLQRAIGTSVPYVKTDPKTTDLVFARSQSQATREMEWEGRIRPMMPWSTMILWGIVAILLGIGAALVWL